MDRIELRGLSFRGRHGASPGERERDQEFLVDVDLECDLTLAGRTDDLGDTVDYKTVYRIARDVIEGPPASLLEALAARIAGRVLDSRGVKAVSVRVTKRPASMEPLGGASVHIERTRA